MSKNVKAVASIVASITPISAFPNMVEGRVTVKGNLVTVENVPYSFRSIKKATKSFSADSVVAYRKGDKGFVIYMETSPIIKVWGDIISSNDPSKVMIETDQGDVVVNQSPAVSLTMLNVAEDSKDASEAKRIQRSRVKIKAEEAPASKKPKK